MYADRGGSRQRNTRPISPWSISLQHVWGNGGSIKEVVRYIYVVLLQEEAINKMKRKTETTEDPVEVNYVTKKVKMSSDKCIILFN